MEIPVTTTLWAKDCIERGLKNNRLDALPLAGDPIQAASGLSARFSASLTSACIEELRFQCSSCATLIAYCQALVDLLSPALEDRPRPPSLAMLIASVEGVPTYMHDRAAIALGAYRALYFNLQQKLEHPQ